MGGRLGLRKLIGSVDVNPSASDGSAINYQALQLNDSGSYGGAGNTLTVGSVTFSDTGAAVSATFTNPSAGIAGLVSGSAASATASAQTVTNVDVDGDGTINTSNGDLATGQVLTLTLTSPSLTVGTGSAGFTVSATAATISALLPQVLAAPATDTRYWIGADVTGLSGSLSVGSVADAQVSSGSLVLNEAGGEYTPATGSAIAASPLDWSTALSSQTPTALVSVAGSQANVSGDLTELSLGDGLLVGSAAFQVSQTVVGNATLGLTNADRVEVNVTGLDAFVGVSGFGVEVKGNVGFEILAATGAGDSRVWFAAVGSNLTTSVTFPQ